MAVSGSGGRARGSAGSGGDGGTAAAAERTRVVAGPQVYVVQRRWLHPVEGGGEEVVWTDVCTVSVPPRSKRRTIVEAARRQVAIEMPAVLRVLDAAAAVEVSVAERPRDPELVFG